jgi:hypothetical protein
MMTFKSYSNKATAFRGLSRHLGVAAEGRDLNDFLTTDDGKWGFDPAAVDTAVFGDNTTEEDENLILTCGHSTCPHCGIHLSNGLSDFEGMEERHGSEKAAFKHQQHEWMCLACNGQWGKPIEVKGSTPRGEPTRHYTNKSEVKGAVQVCHDFYNANPDLRRKDAVAGAVALGVAFYTARTQYQKWFKARRTAN